MHLNFDCCNVYYVIILNKENILKLIIYWYYLHIQCISFIAQIEEKGYGSFIPQ